MMTLSSIIFLSVFFLSVQLEAFYTPDVGQRSRRSTLNNQTSCNYTYVPNRSGCDACGNVTYTENVRIVGGIEANPYSWPAQVLIIETITETYSTGLNYYRISKSYMCGGTLLNRYTVLTAAHCIQTSISATINGIPRDIPVTNPFDGSQFTVYVGAYDISFYDFNTLPSAPTVQMSVWKVIRHPSFNSTNLLNDIAILQLSNEVVFNEYIQPACLPNPIYGPYPTSNNISTVFASGWGSLSEGGSTPSKLYNVQLFSYPISFCSLVENKFSKNWNSQICAGLNTGDSGGGLYIYDPKISKFVVVGVTSYGYGCANKLHPGIYTRTSFFYDWIQANIAITGDAKKWNKNCILTFISIFSSILIY